MQTNNYKSLINNYTFNTIVFDDSSIYNSKTESAFCLKPNPLINPISVPDLANNSFKSVKKEINIENKNEVSSNHTNFKKDKIEDNFIHTFLRLLSNDVIESGYFSSCEVFFRSEFKKNNDFAKKCLQKIFLDNFDSIKIITAILNIISHLEYNEAYPECQIIAITCLSNKNIEIQEYVIKVFENWENKDSINYLKSITCSRDWLQDYLNDVISYLEGI